MPSLESSAEEKAVTDAKWWNQEWLKFPSVSLDEAFAHQPVVLEDAAVGGHVPVLPGACRARAVYSDGERRMWRRTVFLAILTLIWLGTLAPTSAQEDGIWLDVWGCKIWVKDKRATISTAWDGSCRLGKAQAKGTFARTFKAEDGLVLTETYVGTWIEGKQQGAGSYEDTQGVRYQGGFKNGNPHGRGVYVGADGGRYDGDWQDGVRSGRGVYLWLGGGRYDGDWVDDRRSGYGVYLGANGEKYEGEFKDGRYHGRGVFVWPDGPKFVGGFKDGVQHGRGVLHVASGDRVHGEFQGGKLIGTARCWRQNRNRWSRCRQDGEVIKDVK